MARQTSIESYRAIRDRGLLSRRRMQVYEVLFHHGPLTAGEIWARYLRQDAQIDSIRPRMAELERLGVVRVVGERACSVTGSTCVVWDVTACLPGSLNPAPAERLRCQLCKGKGYLINPQYKFPGFT